jgi:catechol 2,3-dioxygenase
MTFAIDPGAGLSHATLQVADLERALPFYEDVLGLRVTGRLAGRIALLGGGERHHHVALSTGRPQLALRYPTRDGNLLALSRDRPPQRWPRTASGSIAVVSLPLDLERLLAA